MDYPVDKLKVWLLDDGGTDQKCNDPDRVKAAAARRRRAALQSLCNELGVNYLTRAKNEHAKAGNMNNGLKHSSGEIVVVFDADHAPFRSFLRETVGYFARDPKLFLVQTPHVFLNPDPIEKNLRTFAAHAVRERDVLLDHPARARQVERLILLRLGGAAPAHGAGKDRRLLRHHHHRGLRDRASSFTREAGTASMSTSR